MAGHDTHGDSCGCHQSATASVNQTLEELDFERGIWSASLNGETTRIKKYLEEGGDPNTPDSSGYSALHYAARNGHLDICRILLDHGASVNTATRSGASTPLQRAAYSGNTDVVQLLLQRKAAVCFQDADGKTALHKAAERSHIDIIKMLISADVNAKNILDFRGKRPLDYILDDSTVIRELLS